MQEGMGNNYTVTMSPTGSHPVAVSLNIRCLLSLTLTLTNAQTQRMLQQLAPAEKRRRKCEEARPGSPTKCAFNEAEAQHNGKGELEMVKHGRQALS